MISICCPTRGRPDRFERMVRSARLTAREPLEFCAWLDDDDESVDRYPKHHGVRYGFGPRPYIGESLCTSGLWNDAWSLATGEIGMLAGDDFIFRTPGWDTRVEAAFAAVPDKIVMVYADDGTKRKAPVNLFVHRRWIEAVGFTPNDYEGWMADEHIWTIAALLERVEFLKDVRILHVQRKGSDPTYRDGEQAREAIGGIDGLRRRFFDAEHVADRHHLMSVLRDRMTDNLRLQPTPLPHWYEEALQLTEEADATQGSASSAGV